MNEKNQGNTSSPLNDVMEFWMNQGKGMIKESIKSIEDAAKQIIVVAGILEGIYFHAITYSDIRGSLTTIHGIFYLAPLALWLISIFFAIRIFSPRVYETNIASSRESKETFTKVVEHKHRNLRISQKILVVSFAFLFIAMLIYLF
ncbi:MAG: hypothetical protein WBD28_04125 [Candidatus Zixiibacteriota bacterium]